MSQVEDLRTWEKKCGEGRIGDIHALGNQKWGRGGEGRKQRRKTRVGGERRFERRLVCLKRKKEVKIGQIA